MSRQQNRIEREREAAEAFEDLYAKAVDSLPFKRICENNPDYTCRTMMDSGNGHCCLEYSAKR